jgi:hypothetical protein
LKGIAAYSTAARAGEAGLFVRQIFPKVKKKVAGTFMAVAIMRTLCGCLLPQKWTSQDQGNPMKGKATEQKKKTKTQIRSLWI